MENNLSERTADFEQAFEETASKSNADIATENGSNERSDKATRKNS